MFEFVSRCVSRGAIFLVMMAVTGLGSVARADGDAPYVDSKITKDRFKEITAEDMDLLRSKKILFLSRSFGLNLCAGLGLLAKDDKKYEFLSSYQRFDVAKAGGDLSIIPADLFEKTNFVHSLATYWPHTKRMEELDELMRKPPHNFGKQADIVIVYFHTAIPGNFDQYSQKMDALVKDFPKTRFIYVTSGFQGPAKDKENENAHAWSELVRAKYKGKQPLYDLGKILSDDYRSGHAYAPEYSQDPASVHPNLPAGETMMAKGFLLLLRDTLKWKPIDGAKAPNGPGAPPKGVAGDSGATTQPAGVEAKAETLPPSNPEYKAVQAILTANGLTKKKVDGVAVVENGHVVKLYLQEGGIKSITDDIGKLPELRLLHVYGDRNLKLPLLTHVSPAIAKCTKLEELLLNNNNLTALPPEIVGLTNLTQLSIADNKLKTIPPAVKEWLTKYDPKGLELQKP